MSAENSIRNWIISGIKEPGEALPSGKELAKELGVSQRAVWMARARLEAEGLVSVERGRGTRVRDYRESGRMLLLPHLAQPEVDRDALELRRMVLAEAVARASDRATFEDVADLDEIAQKQSQSDLEPAAFREGDLAFFDRILQTSASLPLRFVFHGLADWLRARPALHDQLLDDRSRAVAGYQAILNLVRGGDADLARKAVRGAFERTDSDSLGEGAPDD